MEDEMNVKLISYSQQAINADKQDEFEFDLPNLQDLVAYCARVSNPSNQANSETSERLIKYLIKHKHWSPLEMVSACIEVETTRMPALVPVPALDKALPQALSR